LLTIKQNLTVADQAPLLAVACIRLVGISLLFPIAVLGIPGFAGTIIYRRRSESNKKDLTDYYNTKEYFHMSSRYNMIPFRTN